MANVNYTVKNVDSFIITGFDHLQNQKFLGFLILFAYMLILFGNILNLSIILTARHLHKPMYILISNLAIVDIMYTSCSSPTMISVLLAEIKTVSYYSCLSRMFFYHLGDFTECMALTLMAIDRFIAIWFPLRYHSIVTNSRVILLILLTWMAGFGLVGFVISVVDNLPYCQPVIRYVYCDGASLIRAACVDPEPYFFLGAMISLWPLCGQFSFIFCTYAVLAYSVAKLTNNSNKKQMINTCVSHVIVLLSYFAPKLVSSLLTRLGIVLTLTERNALQIVAAMTSPLINPAVYSIRTKEIRKRLADVFLFKKVAPIHLKTSL
ncbi:olfactory receptor 6N1-like [Misgurnus anguillicaudatus]|uniref:olfactory receptor 6N1-like n=1 Tax=Misgurnus anguillicaudatus TaxID=75329 RepID=UPI003CCF6604